MSGNSNMNLLDLANMFGVDLTGLGVTTTTRPTTTTKSGFSLNDVLQLGGLSNSSPLSLLTIINAFSGGTSGGTSSSLSTLAALLPLLPIGQQLLHTDSGSSSNAAASPQLTLGLISSIPQIVGLIDSFANYKLPVTNVRFYSFF